MENTRSRLLYLLVKAKGATTTELAANLGLALASVRRHLDILQRDNLVTFEAVHTKTGRPHHTYRLTEVGRESLPKQYDYLAEELLTEIWSLRPEELRKLDGAALLQLLVGKVAQRRVSRYQDRLLGKNLKERLMEVVNILKERNYLPSYEKTGSLFTLRSDHCPYQRVSQKHPELCKGDLLFLEGLLRAPVTIERCLARGDDLCLYLIKASISRENPTPH